MVYSLAAQAGDRTTYDQVWELARNTGLQEEKMRLFLALARFQQPELLQETLERTLTPDVRSQDTISVVGAVAFNLKGRTWLGTSLRTIGPNLTGATAAAASG